MNKRFKPILCILALSTILMLTACGGDEGEVTVNNEGTDAIRVATEEESSFVLTASIADGESTIGQMTDDLQLGMGYVASVGTDNYDPDNPFKITRDARPIRKIQKQDVYGNILTDDFYLYRNKLDKNEQRVYDQIYANAIELDPEFKLTSKVKTGRMRDIFDSVRLDNPDLFWLSTSYSFSYDNNDNITSVTLDFYDMVNDLGAYKKVFYNTADSVLEYAMQFESDIDKVKYIHDLLTNINTYEFGPLDQSAYSGICVGKTVCAGYANAFQYYMQRLGIRSAVLFGDAGENHAWSMVYLDGDYYEMDVTWDDPVGNDPNTYYYNYFNKTTSEISATRTRQAISAKLPKANGTVYSFPNWYGSDPGRDFSSINYGKPKTTLPHLYPSAGAKPNQNKPADADKKEVIENEPVAVEPVEKEPVAVEPVQEATDNKDVTSERDELEQMISGWSDAEWDEFWDEMAEVLTEEELQEVDEMDWDDFIDLMYEMFYEE